MVSPTLIHGYYEYANPASPFLPKPTLGGSVGLLCPQCSTPMTYKRENEDSWLMGCPVKTNDKGHIWKTWRCDQLNHELALINAGRPPPIISEPSDWGPRVSPRGKVLPPRPVAPKKARYQPFTHRAVAVGNSNNSKPNALSCKRIYEGNLSQNHKKVANKDCPNQYCLGCCVAYGTAPCRKHTRPATNIPISQPNHHGLTPQQIADFGMTEHQLHLNTLGTNAGGSASQPPKVQRRQPPAARPQPHKWAQAADTLGRRLPIETMAIIQKNRAERDQAAARQQLAPLDETKLATISLWVNSVAPQTITAYFPRWPIADLEQSDLLMEAIHKVVPQWNRALSVWDYKLHSWRDTMVHYPLRCPQDNPTIIMRLMTVNVPSSALPPSQNEAPPQTPTYPPAAAFISSTALPPICDASPPTFTPDTSKSAMISAGGWETEPSGFNTRDFSNVFGVTGSPLAPSPTPLPTQIEIDLINSGDDAQLYPNDLQSTPPDDGEETPVIQSAGGQADNDHVAQPPIAGPSSPPVPTLQTGWPSNSLLISGVLDWYKETNGGSVKRKWTLRWGGEWKLVPSTMYRYRAWVEEVGYETMCERFHSEPQATVGEARSIFQDAFNYVAGVGKAQEQEMVETSGVAQ